MDQLVNHKLKYKRDLEKKVKIIRGLIGIKVAEYAFYIVFALILLFMYGSERVFNFLLLDHGRTFISTVCLFIIGLRHGVSYMEGALQTKSSQITHYEKNKINVLEHLDPFMIETMKEVIRDEHAIDQKALLTRISKVKGLVNKKMN